MKRINIGLDVSTTRTGVCIMDADTKEVVSIADICLRTYSDSNLEYNLVKMKEDMESMILNFEDIAGLEVTIGIELANFKNNLLTNRFNLYGGAFASTIVNFNQFEDCKFNVKTFNSSKWQPMVGITNGITQRVECKQLAREFAKKHCETYKESWSEDMCDAYCIAYHLDKIKSNEVAIMEKKQSVSRSIKKIQETNKVQKMIAVRQAKLAKLDKVRNKKEVVKITCEIEKLMKGGKI